MVFISAEASFFSFLFILIFLAMTDEVFQYFIMLQ